MTKMNAPKARYTLEFKQEAVRLVEGGQSIAAAARTLGLVEQTSFNWVKAHRQGKLTDADSKAVSAEQIETSRLRAELARVKMERNILAVPGGGDRPVQPPGGGVVAAQGHDARARDRRAQGQVPRHNPARPLFNGARRGQCGALPGQRRGLPLSAACASGSMARAASRRKERDSTLEIIQRCIRALAVVTSTPTTRRWPSIRSESPSCRWPTSPA